MIDILCCANIWRMIINQIVDDIRIIWKHSTNNTQPYEHGYQQAYGHISGGTQTDKQTDSIPDTHTCKDTEANRDKHTDKQVHIDEPLKNS